MTRPKPKHQNQKQTPNEWASLAKRWYKGNNNTVMMQQCTRAVTALLYAYHATPCLHRRRTSDALQLFPQRCSLLKPDGLLLGPSGAGWLRLFPSAVFFCRVTHRARRGGAATRRCEPRASQGEARSRSLDTRAGRHAFVMWCSEEYDATRRVRYRVCEARKKLVLSQCNFLDAGAVGSSIFFINSFSLWGWACDHFGAARRAPPHTRVRCRACEAALTSRPRRCPPWIQTRSFSAC